MSAYIINIRAHTSLMQRKYVTKPKRPISEEEAVETALGVRVPDCSECKYFKQKPHHKLGGSAITKTCEHPSNKHIKLPLDYTEILYPGINTNKKNDCPFFIHKRKRKYVNASSGR